MKKTLKISLNDNNFLISCEERQTIVLRDDLIVKAKDLYDCIFFDVVLGEKLDINCEIDEGIIDSADIRIANDIKSIITAIENKINSNVSTDENSKDNINNDELDISDSNEIEEEPEPNFESNEEYDLQF
ncbi:MAG: hypothetical protein SOU07_05920 [Bacilli bacterium]|nr:hypothetical protein [Acholeplasmataceae bacterium]MDY2902958.1 hypothetical protein [Bacilli bacterium]